MKLLHAKWLKSQGADRIIHYHPKMLAFEASVKKLRSKEEDDFVTVFWITLTFSEDNHVNGSFNKPWSNGDKNFLYCM